MGQLEAIWMRIAREYLLHARHSRIKGWSCEKLVSHPLQMKSDLTVSLYINPRMHRAGRTQLYVLQSFSVARCFVEHYLMKPPISLMRTCTIRLGLPSTPLCAYSYRARCPRPARSPMQAHVRQVRAVLNRCCAGRKDLRRAQIATH